MKFIGSELFHELRRLSSNVAVGWKLTRTDGFVIGFTSYDVEFTHAGVTYVPTNAFAGTAAVAKNNLSVDNMSAVVLTSDSFVPDDLVGGVWDNALVEVFWINPARPEWGVVPIRGGRIGDVKVTNGKFEVELRSLTQTLQQPFSRHYTIDCGYKLGDDLCKVKMSPGVWTAATKYYARVNGEASVGAIVKPTVYNGFWYMATAGNQSENMAWGFSKQYGNSGAYLSSITGAPAFTPGAVQQISVTLPVNFGISGGSQPTWPTSLGATVADGGVTWTAIHAREVEGTVTSGFGRVGFYDATNTKPAKFFQYGVLTWLTGSNAGSSGEVRDFRQTGLFDLLEPTRNHIDAGDTYRVTQGCSKLRAKCRGSVTSSPFGFNNVNNFGGFADMPTEDKALQTPNAPDSVPEDTTQDSKI